jgi:hypothetical protein
MADLSAEDRIARLERAVAQLALQGHAYVDTDKVRVLLNGKGLPDLAEIAYEYRKSVGQ